MKSRTLSMVCILVLVAVLVSACGTAATPEPQPTATEKPAPAPTATPEPAEPTIQRGGVLKVGFEADFINLDPAHQEAWVDGFPPEMVYETLLRWNPVTLVPEPLLAKSWETSDDLLTWTFKLQEGVKWHSGDDFVAADVKYTIDRILNPDEGSSIAAYLESIESVEVIDDHTVALHLKEPFAPLLNTLCYVPPIQNQKFVEAAGGQTPRTMMGTGPFMFDEWIPDQVLRFKKNPNYWQMGEDGEPLPYLDGMELLPSPDETARVADFLSGVTDMIELVPDKDVQSLQDNPDVEMAGPGSMWWSYCGWVVTEPPFDDKRVRQAISWAMDRDEIADVGLFGQVFPMSGAALPEWHWAYTGVSKYDHQDMEKAKALLEEAGYGEGFETTIYAGEPYQSEITLAEMTASYMQELGITANVEIQEWGTFIDNILSFTANMHCTGNAPVGDPDDVYYPVFHTDGFYNVFGYSNPDVDALLDEGRREPDPEKRKDIYRQVEELLLEDTPLAFGILHQEWQAMHPYVKNYIHTPNTKFFTLNYVWLDK